MDDKTLNKVTKYLKKNIKTPYIFVWANDKTFGRVCTDSMKAGDTLRLVGAMEMAKNKMIAITEEKE